MDYILSHRWLHRLKAIRCVAVLLPLAGCGVLFTANWPSAAAETTTKSIDSKATTSTANAAQSPTPALPTPPQTQSSSAPTPWQPRGLQKAKTPPTPAEKPNAESAAVENLPPPAQPGATVHLPLNDPSWREKVQINNSNDRITLKVREAPLNVVLALLAEQHRLNIVTADQVSQPISVTLNNVTLEQALDAITLINGYTWARQNGIILVTAIGDEKSSSPILQGQIVQVFTLNYVLANDVDKVVKGLLSPVGVSFVNQTMPTDQRKAAEQVVVQDMPTYVARVANYIQQVDQPPRQVLVEAHVLQVDLKGDYAAGVNFQAILNVAGADVTLGQIGFADPTATTASFLKINGTDLNALIQCLTTITDAKTLATPKVAVLNGQESKIQVGQKLGYKTLQTTQTSTLENVQFLETGVILKVTPNITADGQVLLDVKPEISDGQVNPATGLPDSNTTEVNTKVLLGDGEALVIGGLIKEGDSETVNKLPLLGDAKYVGWIFQRRTISRKRTETIIALLPRIIPESVGARQQDCIELNRAMTPLVERDLHQVERHQWEPDSAREWPWHHQPLQRVVPNVRPVGPAACVQPVNPAVEATGINPDLEPLKLGPPQTAPEPDQLLPSMDYAPEPQRLPTVGNE
jgi:type II secretory pathway component GspD/PulD (secretin)